ncbi:MAG TPA: glycine betaine ABC transporter substrate-binding protein [Halanaerobiales bacterium]|nr:glycine betaine ABC transporter substrate-binding protein [Halanaerobiales bacterium]
MKKLLTILAISAILISSFSLFATAQNSDNVITLGDSNWPGLRGKNAIVNYILENIGYKVERTSATDPMLRQGIINGDIDIYLGTWMPSLQKARTQNQDKQHLVTKNMHNGLLGMAVPKYVAEQGVTSLEDLQEHADKFDKKLYVGPAGWVYDGKIREAQKDNIYNLEDWELVSSNPAALWTELEQAIENEEWIVWAAWQPHWMNTVYDMVYLEDPETIFGNKYSWVETLTRKGFPEEHPQVTTFLKNFIIKSETQSLLSYQIGEKEKDADEFAKKWVKDNIYRVSTFLALVEAPNGEPAIDVLRENIGLEK